VALFAHGCFYVPPINPEPETPDAPPALIGVEREEIIDLTIVGNERFGVDVILDVNEPEVIRFAFLAEFPTIGDVQVSSGELVVRDPQSFTGVTEYESPVWEPERCVTPLDGLQDTVQITLVVTDEVPDAQKRDGFSEWTILHEWNVSFLGQCPGGS
jgi:hypothetical protein